MNAPLTPKQSFLAACEKHSILIEHTVGRHGHHLHVYAPDEQQFSGFLIDELSLWDDFTAPDWQSCLNELEAALPLEKRP